MKTAIRTFGAACTVFVVYLLAFLFIAGVLHAEHWSFLIAFVPAFIAGTAVMLSGEGGAKMDGEREADNE